MKEIKNNNIFIRIVFNLRSEIYVYLFLKNATPLFTVVLQSNFLLMISLKKSFKTFSYYSQL